MSSSNAPFRGGRVFSDDEAPIEPQKPKRVRYPCFAEGCPMPGTIFPNGASDGKVGTCAWHYAVQPTDIPKVTQVLRDWMCVSAEILQARRCLGGALASDPAGLQREFDAAWQRLMPLAASWESELRPGTIRTSKGVDTGFRQGYSDWAKHLERFIGSRVVEVLSTHRRSA